MIDLLAKLSGVANVVKTQVFAVKYSLFFWKNARIYKNAIAFCIDFRSKSAMRTKKIKEI